MPDSHSRLLAKKSTILWEKEDISFHQPLQGRPDYAYCLRMKKEAETMQRKRKIGDLEVGLYETVIISPLPQLSKFGNFLKSFLFFWPVTRIRDI